MLVATERRGPPTPTRVVVTTGPETVTFGLRLAGDERPSRYFTRHVESNALVHGISDLLGPANSSGAMGRTVANAKVIYSKPYDFYSLFFHDGSVLGIAVDRKSLLAFDSLEHEYCRHARFTRDEIPSLKARRQNRHATMMLPEYGGTSSPVRYRVAFPEEYVLDQVKFFTAYGPPYFSRGNPERFLMEDWVVFHFKPANEEIVLRVKAGGIKGFGFISSGREGRKVKLVGVNSLLVVSQSPESFSISTDVF